MFPPKKLYFQFDGVIPNSALPLLRYQNILEEKGERPKADQNIAQVTMPEADPLLGKGDGLKKIWGKYGCLPLKKSINETYRVKNRVSGVLEESTFNFIDRNSNWEISKFTKGV